MKNIMRILVINIFCFVLLFAFSGCKTKPVHSPDPSALLVFKSIEAPDIYKTTLFYDISVKQPGVNKTNYIIEEWTTVINGIKTNNGVNFSSDVSAGEIRLEFDIPALAEEGLPLYDDFTVDLFLDIVVQAKETKMIHANAKALFPYIREPVFSITEIAILKADLVNTRFRVAIKIDNLNPFPVDLSSVEYTLYGNNLLWAEGKESSGIHVPPKNTYRGNLFLIMNFINMKRDLLDQIIRLEDVNYRFTGKAVVSAEIDYLPKFHTDFNLAGYSKVLER